MFRKVKSLFLKTKTNFFKNFFVTAVILEWNKLDVNIRNWVSCNVFKRVILTLTRPEPNQVFNVDRSQGLKFLTRITLGLSHLADHKFMKIFQYCVNPVCSCCQEIETSTHFLLDCPNYHCARQTLFEKVKKIDSSTLKQNDQVITKCLLLGNEKLQAAQSKSTLTSTIEFLQATERFKPHCLIKSLMEWYLQLTVIFNGYSKLAGKVSKKHVLNISQFTSTLKPVAVAFLSFHC